MQNFNFLTKLFCKNCQIWWGKLQFFFDKGLHSSNIFYSHYNIIKIANILQQTYFPQKNTQFPPIVRRRWMWKVEQRWKRRATKFYSRIWIVCTVSVYLRIWNLIFLIDMTPWFPKGCSTNTTTYIRYPIWLALSIYVYCVYTYFMCTKCILTFVLWEFCMRRIVFFIFYSIISIGDS